MPKGFVLRLLKKGTGSATDRGLVRDQVQDVAVPVPFFSSLVSAVALLLAILGCSSDSPAAGSSKTASAASAQTTQAQASPPPQPTARANPGAWHLPRDYKLPFPHRTEMFVPPDQTVAAKTVREVAGTELALKGFVEFEGRRVVLEIDGKVVCLGEGEQRHGIAVVAVNPPQVTLQHHGRQWTESLLRKPFSPPPL
jgi:hypothetical protein